jgi:1-acyl-sn-glycerol-3-phosphate acyltransferase
VVRVVLKTIGVVAATLLAVSVPLVARALTLNSPRVVARVGSLASWLWSRWLCTVLRIEVSPTGRPAGGVCVVAANHISYLDIVVLGSLYRTQFVAKSEIRSWPLFGWISRAAGTLFVDRASPRDAVRAIRRIEGYLAAGVPVTLFPEGGTSPGASVRPFLPTLLEPAAAARVPCYAASVSYETPGEPAPPSRTICWHDGSNFAKHMLRVMALDRIEVRVRFSSAPVLCENRKELARRLWEDVQGSFVPIRQEPFPRRCAP